MEALLIILGLYIVVALLVLLIWVIVKVRRHGQMLDQLEDEVRQSNREVVALRD
jgi:uncharacterized protein YoxC|uniref:hypothetical protein n=1 Tax=Cephaloticoccus sp. TaxID=1985742 RepID=UPI0040498B7E